MELLHRLEDFGFVPAREERSFIALAWAYRRAAELLSTSLPEELRDNPVALSPIVYLYRHSTELYIKGILIEYGADHDIRREDVVQRDHRLAPHLEELRAIAQTVHVELQPQLERYILGFDKSDPFNVEHRYPETKKGEKLRGIPDNFNFEHFVRDSDAALEELADISRIFQNEYYRQILRDEGIDV